ncbi:MAG TPA: ribonuclease R [Pirellulales bacterium]|jgi:ribonuclease R
MSSENLERALLELLKRPEYRPIKPKLIAKHLHLSQDRVHDLKRLIKKLVKRGVVSYGPNHLVLGLAGAAETAVESSADAAGQPAVAKTVASTSNRVTGVFRRAAGGFGFVRPVNAGVAHTREQDIYVSSEDAGDAASGDTVLVRLGSKDRGGRFRNPRGVIVEVLERETNQYVGAYFEAGGLAMVQVDGTVFTKPIIVGDPGAKNAKVGDKVVFEMVRFPTHTHGGEGVITEVLGPRGQPGVDTMSIIREFNLPEHFADDTLEAARQEALKFDEQVHPGRDDMTGEVVITIDPVDARDFDDAISLERTKNGHWRLGVHIADVSHFVRPGSPLDREALKRATSVYLPDRVIPMLPEVISNGLASLQPDRVRYTKTAMIEFTADGARVAVDLHSAAIKSKRRFTYEEIDEYLANPDEWRKKLTPEVFELVARMHELAMMLRKRRFKRGSLELSLSEVKVDLDDDGKVCGAHRVINTVSHQIIEEFMLAANEAVADTLAEEELHFLRRVHPAPDPRRLQALTDFVTELGFKTDSLENRFEIQKLLALVHDRPERQAVNYAILRSLAQAVYGPQVDGHYALASDCYCHFTSPIRRYPDLTIHRLIDAILRKKKPRNDLAELVSLGEHCSTRERRAEAAERELKKIKLLDYLSTKIGLEMDAVITGVEEFGLFAQGIELPAEGLIHVTSLADDFYSFDRRSHSLTGRRSGNAFRLGDLIRVQVARIDPDRRELDLRIVDRRKRTPIVEPPKKTTGRSPLRSPGEAVETAAPPNGRGGGRAAGNSGGKTGGKKSVGKKSSPRKGATPKGKKRGR